MIEQKKIGHLLSTIKKNSDRELELISNINDKLGFSASPAGIEQIQKRQRRAAQKTQTSPNGDVISPKAPKRSPSGAKKTANDVPKKTPSVRKGTQKQKTSQNGDTSVTNSVTGTGQASPAVTVNVTVKAPPAKQDRKNESTVSAVTRKKPVFNKTSAADGKQNAPVSVQKAKSEAAILSQFVRDKNGRLRHAAGEKKGQYASEAENKAYETAMREQNKESLKKQGVIAKILTNSQDYLRRSADADEAVDAVGAAAGGSFFYAAKDAGSLLLETSDKIKSLLDKGDKEKGAQASDSQQTQERIADKSRDLDSAREQEKQTDVLIEQTDRQKRQYRKALRLLAEIARNKPQDNGGLFGSLTSVLSGLRDFGKIKTPTPPNVPKTKVPKTTVPKANVPTTPKGGVKSVLSSTGKVLAPLKSSKLPYVANAAAIGGIALDVSKREDLTTADKFKHLGVTASSMWAGTKAGAMAGSALIPIPVVGTLAGGIIGGWLGGKYGYQAGDFLTSAETKKNGLVDRISHEMINTPQGAINSKNKKVIEQQISDPRLAGFGRGIITTTAPEKAAIVPALKTKPVKFNQNDAAEKRIDQYDSIINATAKKHGLPPDLIRSVIRQESLGKADATSYANAQGLMQLMPATAKDLGVKNAYDPAQNVEGGTKYLSRHVNKYKKLGYGDEAAYKLALASYNAGGAWVDAARAQTNNSLDADTVLAKLADPTLVRKKGGSPRSASNIKQTSDYVRKIMGGYSYRVSNSQITATQAKTRAENLKANAASITAVNAQNQPISERVSEIDAKTQMIAPAPQKVVVTNPQTTQQSIKTVTAPNGKNSNQSSTTINAINSGGNPVIPTDFDDQTLKLIGMDLN